MKRNILKVAVFFLASACLFSFAFQPVLAASKGKYGGILKVNHSKPAGVIGDPMKIRAWNHEFIDNTLQTLIRPSDTKLGTYEPVLATSWKLAPDKSYYEFELRKGVTFHDGSPFNAESAKWNLDRWVNSKRPRLDQVSRVDIIDDYTIRCYLSAWDAITLGDFAKDTFMISMKAFNKNGEKWVDYNPVGTGPFKLKQYKRNVHIKFVKNKKYWKKGLPYLDGITFLQVPDPMSSMAAIKRGEFDAWMGVDPVSSRQMDGVKGIEHKSIPALHNLLQFNSEDPSSPWADKRMREALEYALDKPKIAKSVGRGYFIPVYSIIHSIPEGAGTTPRTFDPEKARRLVKEAGYEGLNVKLYFATGPDTDAAVAVQAALNKIGLNVTPVPLQGSAHNQKLFEPMVGSDLIFGNQRGSRSEVLGPADETLGRGSVFFQGTKRPQGFYFLLEQAMQQLDIDDALNYLHVMEKIAYDDAMFTPIYAIRLIVLQSSKVKGANWFWSQQPYPDLEQAWLDD